MFPLAGRVAVVGSRLGSPFGVAPFACAVAAAGGFVVTGCARGVDAQVAAALAGVVSVPAAAPLPASGHLRVLAASRAPVHLAQRTRRVISAACAVAIFPPSGQPLGPGSALALRLAVSAGLPVFFAGPVLPGLFSGWRSACVWVARLGSSAAFPGFPILVFFVQRSKKPAFTGGSSVANYNT